MEPLADPRNDRKVKTVKPPPHRPLDHALLFPTGIKKPNWTLLKQHLHGEGRIEKAHIKTLIDETNKILKNEGNLIYLQDPITVVGDIHGQYYDLERILEVGGNPENTKYLFLGDFVDRGSFSIEVLILLYSLKIAFPNTVSFIRGNHECRQMTNFFNFRSECLYKYDQEIYDLFMESFDLFPLACIINQRFLAVHGGISPDLKLVEDINLIDRFKEPPKQGIFCDLLWSDPVDNEKGELPERYKFNEVRGCSFFYGIKAATDFLENNELLTIIRAHEAQLEGYKMHKWNENDDFPLVITIFSAPNYCDAYNNKGAVIKFDNNMLNIQQFNYSQHPYLLPNFMDVFTWSIPFVGEKVMEMFYSIIKPAEGETDPDSSDEEVPADNKKNPLSSQTIGIGAGTGTANKISARAGEIQNKIRSVAKILKMQRMLREKSEDALKETKKPDANGPNERRPD